MNLNLKFLKEIGSSKFKRLRFSRIDLVDDLSITKLFKEGFEVVCNLAATGVRPAY